MRERSRFPLVAATLFALAVPVTRAADAPVAAPAPAPTASPVASCSCHDGLSHPKNAPGIDLRGWSADGPHLKQGCLACHPGTDKVPHAAGRPARVECASCHAKESAGWSDTVHGRVAAAKAKGVRGCLTCHAEHPFFVDDDPRGRYARTGLLHSCSACHAPMPLNPEVRLPLKPAPDGKSWPSSLHGLIADGDRRAVAACASCHGAHDLFPATDPRSAVHPTRLAENCGRCHDGVQPGLIHGRFRPPTTGIIAGLTNYFDVWYLWGTGTVVLACLGVLFALGMASFLRRRMTRTARPHEDDAAGTDS